MSARDAALALGGALVAGVVMSFGQTVAPGPIAPLFNSAAPVVALAAAVALAGRGALTHVLFGASAGPLAMVGYYATTHLRGFGVSLQMVAFWSVAGVVSGAAMGLAVWALRRRAAPVWRVPAAALFPGVALGEASHGLARISDTTPAAYWAGLALLGAVILARLARSFLDTTLQRVLAVAFAAAVGAALFVLYGVA